MKQIAVEQNKTTANGQNIVEPTQPFAGSGEQESLKYASNSAMSRLSKLEQDTREQLR